MTRMTVAREGEITNNCMILPGAMRCEDEELPVTWREDHTFVVGKARGFQREENGHITFEIELFPDVDPWLGQADLKRDFWAYTYVQPFEAKQHNLVKNAIYEVSSARIRAICLDNVETAASPGGRLKP